jgi:RNA polymerase sigma factor (sigma-70 family)
LFNKYIHLLNKIKIMESEMFNEQLINHKDIINSYALKLTKNKEVAADLTQETLLKALRHQASFSINTNLTGWLLTITKNTFLNSAKRSSINRKITNTIYSESTKEFNNVESFINMNDIEKSINNLKAELKSPFKQFIEGYKYHEIATEMQLPIGTVKSRIFKARTICSNEIR